MKNSDQFPLQVVRFQSATDGQFSIGLCTKSESTAPTPATIGFCGLAIVIASTFVLGGVPAIWYQPTAVGSLWGCIFLAGYLVGGFGRGSLRGMLIALSLSYVCTLGCQAITDLSHADCLLITALLVLSGWAATFFDPDVLPGPVANASGQYPSIFRWSLWDLAFLTLIVACAVQACLHLESSLLMWAAIGSAMFGGVLSSWLACRWVWKDRWSLLNLVSLLALLAIGLSVVHLSAPTGMSIAHFVRWALQGPATVICAQCVTVMLVLAMWRIERLVAGNG